MGFGFLCFCQQLLFPVRVHDARYATNDGNVVDFGPVPGTWTLWPEQPHIGFDRRSGGRTREYEYRLFEAGEPPSIAPAEVQLTDESDPVGQKNSPGVERIAGKQTPVPVAVP